MLPVTETPCLGSRRGLGPLIAKKASLAGLASQGSAASHTKVQSSKFKPLNSSTRSDFKGLGTRPLTPLPAHHELKTGFDQTLSAPSYVHITSTIIVPNRQTLASPRTSKASTKNSFKLTGPVPFLADLSEPISRFLVSLELSSVNRVADFRRFKATRPCGS
jgi:hypothetical protein